MSKSFLLACIAMLVVATSHAGHITHRSQHNSNRGRFGDDFGFRGDYGFGGFPVSSAYADRRQDYFDNKYEDLVADYEDGLADITDFYTSDAYSDILTDTESLIDKYDLFYASVERSTERLATLITLTNDDLTYYTDLLTEYEARTDLSADRLEKLTTRITRIQDNLTAKIDWLTEEQTSLTASLATATTFQTDLGQFYTDIVTAGGGTTTTTETAAAVALMLQSGSQAVVDPLAVITTSPVPEALPATLMACGLGLVLATRRRAAATK